MKKLIFGAFLASSSLLLGIPVEDITTSEPIITEDGYIRAKAPENTNKQISIQSKGTLPLAYIRKVRFSDASTPQETGQKIPLEKELTLEYDNAGHWPTAHYRFYCLEHDPINDIELRVNCSEVVEIKE